MSEFKQSVDIPAGDVCLAGELIVPHAAPGIVLFAHGSGSSRFSPRNRYVAEFIRSLGIGTLLFDMLTAAEEAVDHLGGQLRFDIELLAGRLVQATNWLEAQALPGRPGIGYFGASTGGAAALVVAATLGTKVGAVVSRGGRPDLAGQALPLVRCPTLLIVGAQDSVVLELNRKAYAQLRCEKDLRIVADATHLFEEPGTLEQVARLAAHWFRRCLRSAEAA